MMKKSRTTFLAAMLLSGSSFAAVSLEQALTSAEKAEQGAAIGIKTLQRDGKTTFAVQIITDGGMRHVLIDGESGDIVPRENPEFSVPAFSLRDALAAAEKSGGNVISVRYIDPQMMRPHDGQDRPDRARGKRRGKQGEDRPSRGERRDRRGEARDETAREQSAEKPAAFYAVEIEKDGKRERLALSAEDGAAIEMKAPHRRHGERQAPPQDDDKAQP